MPFFIGTVVIALLFIGNEFIAVFKNFETQNAPILGAVQLVLFRFPYWFSLTLPAGVALGASLAMSRLARESEISAMRGAGISVRRIILPVVIVGALVSVANFYVVEELIPPSQERYRQTLAEYSRIAASPRLMSDVTLKLDRYTASLGAVQTTDDGVLITDVLLIERVRPGVFFVYTAETGTYRDGVWEFQDPLWYRLEEDSILEVKPEDELIINERIELGMLFSPLSPEEETVSALREAIERAQAAGQQTRMLEVAYYVKFSIPASCFVFALTSSLLAISFSRAGPFTGVLISMGLVLFHFNAHIISTEIIGRNGWLEPIWAAWLPNILMFLFGLILLRVNE